MQLLNDQEKNDRDHGYSIPCERFPWKYPDDSINFKGNVYVPTGEFTMPAAVIFAGLVHKYKRGKIVGRETGTACHQMNAASYASMRLPDSGLKFTFPLVKCIFDSISGSGIPYGRGVIPDCPVEFSFDEFLEGRKDNSLDYTLRLIKAQSTAGSSSIKPNNAGIKRSYRTDDCLISMNSGS
jgi:C-terminal processing protease CtpA/Prc